MTFFEKHPTLLFCVRATLVALVTWSVMGAVALFGMWVGETFEHPMHFLIIAALVFIVASNIIAFIYDRFQDSRNRKSV